MTTHQFIPTPRLVASGGPVSRALCIMQDADPDLARIRNLRRAISQRIEAGIALLDALSGDADLEDGGDDEPSIGGDDREHDEAERGIADSGGMYEQINRYLSMGGDMNRRPSGVRA